MKIEVDFSKAKNIPSDKEEELLKEHIENLFRDRQYYNNSRIRSWIKVLRKYRLLKEMAKPIDLLGGRSSK